MKLDDDLDPTAEEDAICEAEELVEFEDDSGIISAAAHFAGGDFGRCCACGAAGGARNILMLERRAPKPGTGWGCILCGLRSDGALAVLCDDCLSDGREPVEVADGYLTSRRRVPIESLAPEPFAHDMARRPGEA